MSVPNESSRDARIAALLRAAAALVPTPPDDDVDEALAWLRSFPGPGAA